MAQPYTDLNPNVAGPETLQNTLNYSRGFDADKSSAGFLKLTADTLDMGIKAGDAYTKEVIRQELTDKIDTERTKTTEEASLVSTKKDLLNSGVPALVDLNGQLEDLSKARSQGVMRDSQYWARIEAISKQARARYAGYREHIDNTVASLVGTIPANKLVSTMMDDAQKNTTAHMSEQEKFEQGYIKENEKWLPPGYAEAVAAGKRPGFNETRAYVINAKRAENSLEQKKLGLNVGNLDNETRNKMTAEVAAQDVGTKVSFALDPILKNIESMSITAQEEVSRSGGLSIQTEANVRKKLGEARTKLTLLMDKTLSDPSYLSLTRDQRNGIRQEFEARLNSMETAFLNKDFGLLTARATSLKAMQESDEATVLRSSELALIAAVNKTAGPQVANTYATKFFKEIAEPKFMDRMVAKIEADRLLTGQSDPGQAIANLSRRGVSPQTINSTVKVPLSMIFEPNVPYAVKDNIIKSYYGSPEKADALLAGAKEQADRRTIFESLVNPQIAKAIKDHSTATGSPALFENYSKWATNAFITNFTKELGDLDSIMASPNIKVTYQNGQFVATPSDQLKERGLTDPVSRTALQTADRFAAVLNGDRLKGINVSIKNMVPVWEAGGVDPNKAIGEILLGYRGSTEATSNGLESVLSKTSRGYRDTIDMLRKPLRLTQDQLGSFFNDIEKIKTDFQNDYTDQLGSLRKIIELADKLRYTPGDRVSTNIEDMTNSPGRFAEPKLTQ